MLFAMAAIPSGSRPSDTPITEIPDSDVPIADVMLETVAAGSSDDAALAMSRAPP